VQKLSKLPQLKLVNIVCSYELKMFHSFKVLKNLYAQQQTAYLIPPDKSSSVHLKRNGM
jgi:hypothetical protein